MIWIPKNGYKLYYRGVDLSISMFWGLSRQSAFFFLTDRAVGPLLGQSRPHPTGVGRFTRENLLRPIRTGEILTFQDITHIFLNLDAWSPSIKKEKRKKKKQFRYEVRSNTRRLERNRLRNEWREMSVSSRAEITKDNCIEGRACNRCPNIYGLPVQIEASAISVPTLWSATPHWIKTATTCNQTQLCLYEFRERFISKYHQLLNATHLWSTFKPDRYVKNFKIWRQIVAT